MRKLSLVLCVLLLATFAFAASAQTVAGGPVALKTIIPSYLAIYSPSAPTVTFDYTNFGALVVSGLPATKLADVLPTWNLVYNLDGTKTLVVCAYLSDGFKGSGSASMPASSLYAQPLGSATTGQFTGTCGGNANAMQLDSIANATFNTGKTEGFSGMFFQTPGGGVVPAPGTYTDTLNIVALVQ